MLREVVESEEERQTYLLACSLVHLSTLTEEVRAFPELYYLITSSTFNLHPKQDRLDIACWCYQALVIQLPSVGNTITTPW